MATIVDEEDGGGRRSERVPPIPGEQGWPLVPFVPIACPKCGALKPRTYGRGGDQHLLGDRLRYHTCQHCSADFQSLELDPVALRRDPNLLRTLQQHALFIAFRCPSCTADKPRTHGQRGRIRLHECQICGRKFRSLQLTRSQLTPQMLDDMNR